MTELLIQISRPNDHLAVSGRWREKNIYCQAAVRFSSVDHSAKQAALCTAIQSANVVEKVLLTAVY